MRSKTFIIILVTLFSLFHCNLWNQDEPDAEVEISVSILDIGPRYVGLMVSIDQDVSPWDFQLFRDSDLILSSRVVDSDTTLYDTILDFNSNYGYRAILIVEGEQVDSTERVSITTLTIDEEISPQIQIPWPSLANSSWPMQHRDPQSTGRSQYSGPSQGVVESIIHSGITESGPSIGYGGSVFIGSYEYPFPFYKIGMDGTIFWTYNFDCQSTPIIGIDSNIYVGGWDSIKAFSPSGSVLWSTDVYGMETLGPNIDREGNLYFIDGEHNLICLNDQGVISWQYHDSRFLHWYDASPTFSPDGTMLYIQGIETSVLAFNIEAQAISWVYGDKTLSSAPVINNSGNIIFIPGDHLSPANRKIVSLYPNGTLFWEFEFQNTRLLDNTEPTIDWDGNIYFATDTLYSLTYRGALRWKHPIEGRTVSPLICDGNNVVFVGSQDLSNGDCFISAFEGNGQSRWVLALGSYAGLGVSPAITEDGKALWSTWRDPSGNLFIIK
ncbi:MAG: PQQ-binding-like beta-propeller repeat protein [Candidatus Marinimicrobia bacterium]|nr:PQQ-binding-like beta-propeller repeat protein [Candidatus Neomarinimicrobiota bacterium]